MQKIVGNNLCHVGHGGGTKPWMAEGRTMQEQLSRAPTVGALGDAGRAQGWAKVEQRRSSCRAVTEFHEPQQPM